MFELTEQSAKVAHVNLRAEKHGEDDVLACDLRFETKMPNTVLASLNPALRGALYERGEQLDLGDEHVTKLRFPLMKYPVQWQSEIVGGRVTLHAPISEDDLVIFGDVNDLKLSPQDGGTVIVSFRLQFLPDGDQAARIPVLLGKMVDISVAKPIAAEGDLVGDGDDHGDGDGDGDGGGDATDERPPAPDYEAMKAPALRQLVEDRTGNAPPASATRATMIETLKGLDSAGAASPE